MVIKMANTIPTPVSAITIIGTVLSTCCFGLTAALVYYYCRPEIRKFFFKFPIVAGGWAVVLFFWSMYVAVAPEKPSSTSNSCIDWALSGGNGQSTYWFLFVLGVVWSELACRELGGKSYRWICRFIKRIRAKRAKAKAGDCEQSTALMHQEGCRKLTAEEIGLLVEFLLEHAKLCEEVQDIARQKLDPGGNVKDAMIELKEEVHPRILQKLDAAIARKRNAYRCRSCQQMCTSLFPAAKVEQAPAATAYEKSYRYA